MRFPHTIQSDARDCGPACLQLLCEYYGKHIEIDRIRRVMNTNREGSSVLDFIQAAEELEISCAPYSISYYKFRKEVPLPCVILWKNHHFVVVYKITQKFLYVSDPAIGKIKYTLKDFASGWLRDTENSNTKRGICIVCSPTVRFKDIIPDNRTQTTADALVFFVSYLKPYRRQIVQVMSISIFMTLLSAIFPVITQSIIDTGIPNKDFNYITILLGAMIMLTLGRITGSWLQNALTLRFSAKMRVSMTSDYLIRLFKMPLEYFEKRLMGDIFQRTADFERIEQGFSNALFSAILGSLNFMVLGIILLIYNKILFLVFIAGTILYISWVLFFWNLRKKIDIHYFTLMAKNNSVWMEFLTKISDIKLYNNVDNERWQWERNQVNLFHTKIKLLNLDQMQHVGSGTINGIKDALLLYFSAVLVINGEMTFGMLTAVQYILGQLAAPVESIVQFIISVQLSTISYARVTDVQRIPAEDCTTTTNDILTSLNKDILLKNIFFRYGGTYDSPALNNVTVTIPNGKTTAIVGASGCGKSTLLKILAGLYAPQSGDMFVGGTNMKSISIHNWRKTCGVITQDSDLLKDTIYNNIVFGRERNDVRVLEAVSIANIRDDIEKMPKGYDTMIGENGRGVSEGQKQRILLARAIYSSPSLLLLDEITGALDGKNEETILDFIHRKMPGVTTVIISHRESTVKNANFVLWMDKGKIVGSGTHQALLKNSIYNSLWGHEIETPKQSND